MIDKYFSNDYVKPIVQEAKPILEEFPTEVATEIATAVLKDVDAGLTEIPWVTIFPSDDRSQIASRLMGVLRTADYDTPAYNPETRLAFDALTGLLERRDAVGMTGANAAYHLVQSVAGKENEHFRTYQDQARLYPQYASIWRRDLWQQFGSEGYLEIIDTDRDLQLMLVRSEGIAERNREEGSDIFQPEESVADAIVRTLDFFDISTEGLSIDDLKNATRILERGLEGYRALAYQLRGLPIPENDN